MQNAPEGFENITTSREDRRLIRLSLKRYAADLRKRQKREADHAKLRLDVGKYDGCILVTTDTGALGKARQAWLDRWADEERRELEQLRSTVLTNTSDPRYEVGGLGLHALLRAVAASDLWALLYDVGRVCFRHAELQPPPAANESDEFFVAWLDGLHHENRCWLAAAYARAVEARGYVGIAAVIEERQKAALAEMQRRPIREVFAQAAAPDSAPTAEGNKWQRRKKRGSAKHTQPREDAPPPKLSDDAAQEIRAAAEADDVEDLGADESLWDDEEIEDFPIEEEARA